MKRFKRTVLMLLPTLLFVLLHASVLVWNRVALPGVEAFDLAFDFFLDWVMCFAYAWALFFSLRCLGKWVFAIMLPFIFVTSAIASYFIYHFNIRVTGDVVGVLFEAEPTLIMAFLTWSLAAWALASLALGVFLVRFCIAREEADLKDKMVFLVSGMFVLMAFTLDGGISRQYLPYSYLRAMLDRAFESQETLPGERHTAQASEQMPEDLAVVLVVGESLRPSHLGLNGYARNTTPNLSKLKNLTSYDNVPSCGPFTRDAVPCIMTSASYLEPRLARGQQSVIDLFRQAGFHTVWVDMQGATASVFDSTINDIINEADQSVSLNTSLLADVKLDEAVLPILSETLAQQKGRTLIVLHLFGSHWPYHTRYPERFQKFTPVCDQESAVIGDFTTSEDMQACGRESLVNAYDNSVLYTDHVLAEIIKKLAGRPSLFFYTSDHGESLGEDGFFLHGNVDKEGRPVAIERRVPILFWHSPQLKIKPVNERITHDYVFHSLLGCAGIKSDALIADLNICAQ